LSERGQAVLSGRGPVADQARVEAFRAVPLFRAVLDSLAGRPVPEGQALAVLLVEEFGETEAKATTAAAKLLDSAGQAGLLQAIHGKNILFKAFSTNFTDHREPTSNLFVPSVRYPQQPQSTGGVGHQRRRTWRGRVLAVHDDRDMEEGLWLDDIGAPGDEGRHPHRLHRVGVAAAAVACLAVVGVPVGLVLSSGGGTPVALPPSHGHHSHLGNGPAERQVLSALSATTDSGSFNFTYALSQTAATAPASTTTSTTTCHEEPAPPRSGASVTPTPSGAAFVQMCSEAAVGTVTENDRTRTVVSGHGVINTSPMGMVATTSLGGIDVRIDGTTVWESDSDGLAPTSGQAGGGTPLASFANLVESTLGTRAGAVAMMGMASPTGYLDLEQGAVTGADQVGTGTVDGTAVTQYQVSLDPTQLANTPGVTPEEATAIGNAIQVLQQQGLTGVEVKISIDASGYIRETRSVASFSDGGTVILDATFSDFGCAGTVLMPGQSGPATPPAGCSTSDTGVAPTTTTTVSPTPAATTKTGPASTYVPPSVPPTTTPTTAPPASTTVPPTTVVAPTTTNTTS
jgi:hypothetical protein